ncbi:MAG: VOC family protein [Bdellovibrionota bacterium]|nr:VOC family protein [Bdellovibrionota bacterium]
MQVSLQHIHIVAQDKIQLARWYCENLDFEILGDIEELGEKEGPIFISGDGGKTALSLFQRKERHRGVGTNCIPAFEISPEDFLKLFDRFNSEENTLEVFDHYLFLSFYTEDPDGSKLEFTSLKHEKLRSLLNQRNIPYKNINPAVSED